MIESHLLRSGYVGVAAQGFDRERAIFPAAGLDFIRQTQPTEWGKLEALLRARRLGPRCVRCDLADITSFMANATAAVEPLRQN